MKSQYLEDRLLDAVFKTTTEYMNYSEDVVEGVSPLEISEFWEPVLSKDSKLKGVGEVCKKKYHPRRPMFLQDPYFAKESKTPKECVIYPKVVVGRVTF